MTLRIATWNLERPSSRSWKKFPAQQETMQNVAADIWVLTETRASISPSELHAYSIHSEPHRERRPDRDERWASIWSRWPLQRLEVASSPWSVAAMCDTEFGAVLVYGTVLPWHAERGDGTARAWQLQYEEIERQRGDWEELRRLHPEMALVVAGDFNQNLDGARWYGTKHGRSLLRDALAAADLVCLTDDDMVASGQLHAHHLVDHICVSGAFVDTKPHKIICWEAVNAAGTRMSDHPGVAVDLPSSSLTS